MKFSLTSLVLLTALLALSATALAEPQPEPVPLAPVENRRPADWQPSRPAIEPKSLIEASVPVRQKAAKAYEALQKTNASGKWKATAASIDQHQAPEWFKDAKFGMFIDWGAWSTAGWTACMGVENRAVQLSGFAGCLKDPDQIARSKTMGGLHGQFYG